MGSRRPQIRRAGSDGPARRPRVASASGLPAPTGDGEEAPPSEEPEAGEGAPLDDTAGVLDGSIEDGPEATVVVGEDGRVRQWNAAAEDLFGWSAEEVVGEPSPIVPDDLQDEAKVLRDRVLGGYDVESFETKRQHKDGELVDVLLSTAPIEDADGRMAGAISVFHDPSKARPRERVPADLTPYRQLVEQVEEYAIFMLDPDGDVVSWNAGAKRINGYAEEEIVGEHFSVLYPEEDRAEGWPDRVLEAAASERAHNDEGWLRRKDGERFWASVTTTALRDDDGEPVGFSTIIRDLSDRRERERELEQADSFFANSRDAFWIVEPEGDDTFRLVRANAALADHTPLDLAELEGKTYEEAFSAEFREEMLDNYRRCVETGEVQTDEQRLDLPAMPTVWRTTYVPIVEDGEVVRILGIGRDVTDEREREAELERQNRRLDQFASVVSHDLRNPLTVAQGQLELAMLSDNGDLEAAMKALERMEQIIGDVMTLARDGHRVEEYEDVHLGDAARAAWETVSTGSATLVVDADRTVPADSGRLQQLLENLFRNAVVHAGEDVTVTVGALDGGFYVEDDGPGVPVEEREEVFETGYSTEGEGAGLGLAIVRNIAEAHDWIVRIDDGSEGGARFAFTEVAASD